jgi:hypothetical protein
VEFLDSDPPKMLMGGYNRRGRRSRLRRDPPRGRHGRRRHGDSVDACPDDPLKAADEGLCGCDVPDVDTDKDGTVNCLEDCPADPNKTDPGVCGCEQPDTDGDGDGTEDCIDNCPSDPNKVDVGECGCGAPDSDSDNDGVLGCHDACSNTPRRGGRRGRLPDRRRAPATRTTSRPTAEGRTPGADAPRTGPMEFPVDWHFRSQPR